MATTEVAVAGAVETPAAAIEIPTANPAPAEVATVAAPAVEPMQISVVAPSDAPAAEPAKAKATKKASRLRKPAVHPPYLKMINDALMSLNERTGSSQYAISKLIEEKHKAHLPANFKKFLLIQLKRFTAAGKLTKVKNSYKISTSAKKAGKLKSTSAIVTKPKSLSEKLKPKTRSAKPDTDSSKLKQKSAVAPAKPKTNIVGAKRKKAAMKPGTMKKKKSTTALAKPKTAHRPAKAAKTSAKAGPGAEKPAAQKPKKYRMKK